MSFGLLSNNYSFNLNITTCYSVPGDTVPERDLSGLVSMFPAPSAAPKFTTREIALKIVFYAVAFLMDIFGNILVLLIICLNKRMHSTTNYLIMNLAVSDILVGLFCMWVHLGNQITQEWPFGEFVCKANTFVQVVAVTSSVLSLTIISGDRFIAIVFPLRARMTTTRAGIIITVTWLISIGVAIPQLIVRRQTEFRWANRHEIYCDEVWPTTYVNNRCEVDQPERKVYYTMFVFVLYFVPILVMILAYSVIVWTLLKRKAPGVAIMSTALAQEKSKRKVIKMLIIVLIVFIICWSPQQILSFWGLFRSQKQFPAFIETLRYVALYVAYLNSSLNPILYCGFNENFRKGFMDAFRCTLTNKRVRILPMRAMGTNVSGVYDSGPGVCQSGELTC